MANKVSFGVRRAQQRVGKLHQFSQLPRCVVPKSCTHHLTHNNNNLPSHKGKKGENQQTAWYVRAAPAGGGQKCTIVCLPGEWWQMSIHFHVASPTCALLRVFEQTHTLTQTHLWLGLPTLCPGTVSVCL